MSRMTAFDDAEAKTLTADYLAQVLKALIANLSPEETDRLLDIMHEAEQHVGDRRRLGRDDPAPFPGRPNPGGRLDPAEPDSRARDARHRRYGTDARPSTDADRRSFARHFPAAARIKVM